jgi:seryl-tRNA synthetase
MIDPKILKENIQSCKDNLAKRGYSLDDKKFLSLENQRKDLQTRVEDLQSQKNKLSKNFGELKKSGQSTDELALELEKIKSQTIDLEKNLSVIQKEISTFLMDIPNLISEDTPTGTSEDDNKLIEEYLKPQVLKSDSHIEITDQISLELGNKLSGSRFSVLKGSVAKLHRSLCTYMINEAIDNGYEETYVPYIVNYDALEGTGQLPKFEEDLFKLSNDQYLIPTAEVPLTNLLRDSTLNESDLPVKLTAHTPCFRSEAGNYGKDTKGMIRQHQFEKVELVKFVHPEESDKALEDLTDNAAQLLDKLELSYRKVVLCTGDLGFSSAKTIDLEVWLPSQNCFREISSCSNFRDFQARRINVKVKNSKNKYIPHTLNGSALAVGRTLVAILENNYVEGEGVRVPNVLSKYLDFSLIEEKN